MTNLIQPYIDKAYVAVLGVFGVWGAWWFSKSKRLKKADEDNAFVDVIDKMVPVIDKIQAPLMKDIERMNNKIELLTDDYIKIQIKLGVMENVLKEKDYIIQSKDNEIKRLNSIVQEQKSQIDKLHKILSQ